MTNRAHCVHCGTTFEPRSEAGISWTSCPHCNSPNPEAVTVLGPAEPAKTAPISTAVSAKPLPPLPPSGHEINPEATREPGSSLARSGCAVVGLLLGVLGIIAGFVSWSWVPGVHAVFWAAGSVAFVAGGWRLSSTDRSRGAYKTGGIILLFGLLGLGAWIVAFATCAGKMIGGVSASLHR